MATSIYQAFKRTQGIFNFLSPVFHKLSEILEDAGQVYRGKTKLTDS